MATNNYKVKFKPKLLRHKQYSRLSINWRSSIYKQFDIEIYTLCVILAITKVYSMVRFD